ncbi:YdcF family protein [Flavobacteriaceae bacterium]|nr:YdcF family protein [Flavobacteriaceae bacterium]
MKQVEGEYEFGKFENQNKADAIVVLSGIMRINEFENDYKIEWGDTDRFFKGIELYNFNKSNIIVFTGGKSPYNKTKKSEGDILKEYAIKFGVKEEDILITKEVLNTSDESYAVTDLIGNKRTIILITSAFHMSRAKSLFEKQGHIVIPYKVDFKTPPKLSWNFIDFIASSGGLRKTEIALREVLGQLYYRI